MRPGYRSLSIGLIIAFLVAGCGYISGSRRSVELKSSADAQVLYDQGIADLKAKRYRQAINTFQKIRDEFPFTSQALDAELKAGEAHYLNKDYPEAAAIFQDFLAVHPTNEKIPYVLYHLGMVHLDQFTSVDRDQKVTATAKGHFERLIKQHPDSSYTEPAKKKLAECLRYLAEHEFRVGLFYLKNERYPAAIERFEGILHRYRDTPAAPEALYYLGESHRLNDNPLKAVLAFQAVIEHYPNQPLAKKAEAQLSSLTAERRDPLALLLQDNNRTPPASGANRDGQATAAARKRDRAEIDQLNLVAKTEVVHEEAESKGFFRRVADTINPFASSPNKQDKRDKPEQENGAPQTSQTAKKNDNERAGILSYLNPFSSRKKAEPAAPERDPRLVSGVDEALKQQGIEVKPVRPQTVMPAIQDIQAGDLPEMREEKKPRPAETKALLSEIDSRLKKDGIEAAGLPPPPDVGAEFQPVGAKSPQSAGAGQAASSSAQSLISGIDAALKRQGREVKGDAQQPAVTGSRAPSLPAGSKPQERVELETKLTAKKGPLYLEGGEFQLPERESAEGVATRERESVETSQSPGGAPSGANLPEAVLKTPSRQPQKAEQTKTAEKKTSTPDEEQSKGALDQIREDVESASKIFKPLNW